MTLEKIKREISRRLDRCDNESLKIDKASPLFIHSLGYREALNDLLECIEKVEDKS